jgi:hypothetical protein
MIKHDHERSTRIIECPLSVYIVCKFVLSAEFIHFFNLSHVELVGLRDVECGLSTFGPKRLVVRAGRRALTVPVRKSTLFAANFLHTYLPARLRDFLRTFPFF